MTLILIAFNAFSFHHHQDNSSFWGKFSSSYSENNILLFKAIYYIENTFMFQGKRELSD